MFVDPRLRDNGGYVGRSYAELFDPLYSTLEFGLPGDLGPAGQSTDLTGRAIAWAGNAAASTTQNKFYDKSLALVASGDRISFPFPAIGSRDFIVDFWFYLTGAGLTRGFFCNNTNNFNLTTDVSGNFVFTTTAGNTSAQVVPLGSWNHFRVSRYGTNCTMFLNGTSFFTFTNDLPYNVGTCYVGAAGSTFTTPMLGYVQDFLLYVGVGDARNFTPPTRGYKERSRRYPPGVWRL